MTPADLIAQLDASLTARGEDVVLRRLISGVQKLVTVRAQVRNLQLRSLSVVAGISATSFVVTISLTQIRAASWPPGAPASLAPPFNVDPAIPVIGDAVIIKGRAYTVKSVDPRAVNGSVVRVQMMVEG